MSKRGSHSAGEVQSATPFPFKWNAGECALVMVDWQRDFCDEGGFGASLGNDVAPLRAAIPAAKTVLDAARAAGGRGTVTRRLRRAGFGSPHRSEGL